MPGRSSSWMAGVMGAAVAMTAGWTAGCAIERDDAAAGGDPAGEPVAATGQTVIVPPTGGPCPKFGCGTNSPVINALEFHDFSVLDAAGTGRTAANDAGFSLQAAQHAAQIYRGSAAYNLRVIGGRIVGLCAAPCTPIQGASLVGAVIPVLRGEARFAIQITGVRTMSFFLGGGQTEAYNFVWTDASGKSQALCNSVPLLEQLVGALPGGSDGPAAVLELMAMQPWEAVVFEGDRIDAAAKTMSADAATDDSWFNIGCAGNALAKLRLTRNTVHGQTPGLAQDWEQRQATLKLLVADYCGGGVPFTVAGQSLVWQGDLMTYFSAPAALEARWTSAGAQCLSNQPRMLHPTSSYGASQFPDIWQAIATNCPVGGAHPPPPPCLNLDVNDLAGTLRMSANPK